MNELKVFENAEFGQIRGVEIDGESWLVGKDVAERLGYSNASKAVMVHVDDEDKRFEMLPVSDSQIGNLVKTAGTMVDVRSMAEYIESPAQADRRARAAKNSNFGRSRFRV